MQDWHPLDRDDPPPVPHDNSDVSNDDIMAMLGGTMLPRDIERRRIRQRGDKLVAERLADLEGYFNCFSTVDLLQTLADFRAGGYSYVVGIGNLYSEQGDAALRKVLATRPHIPSKPERKALRRSKAHDQHGQSKSKDR